MPKITCFKGHPLESAFNKKIAQGVEEYQAANEVISEQYNTIVDNLNTLREGLNVPKLEKTPLDIKAKIEVLEGQIQGQLAEVDAQKLPVEEKSKFVPQNKEITKLVTEYLRAKLGQAINILPETEMLVELRKRGYAKPLSINEKVYGFYDQLSKETYLTEEFLSSEVLIHEMWHATKPNVKEKAAKGDKTAKLLLQKMNDLVIESGFNEKEAIDRYQTAKREELDFNAMIIGSGAVQLNNSLQEAKQLENQGLSEVEIEDRTGWYKQNGQWKMFSKEVAKNFDINKENIKVNQEQTLEEILTNGDIFNYYPQLRKVKVVFYDKLLQDKESVLPKQRNEVGGFTKYGNGEGQSVYVNTFYKQGGQRIDSDIRRTLGHEITHLIQDIEGFPKGGDNLSVLREALTITNTPDGLTATQLKENLSNFDTKNLTANEKNIVKNAIKAVNYISKNQTSKLQEQYTYLFGEVEARAVESIINNKNNLFLNSNQLYTDYFNKFLGSQGIKESDTYKLRNGDISFSTPEDLAREYTERITAIKQAKPQDYWSVDIPSQETIQKAAQEGRIARNEGGMAIVTEDGNMVGLFKDGEGKNISEDLDKKRLSLGGIKKDNFDGYLTKLYKSRGFRVVSRVPFNEEYAPEGWNKELHGTPDVVAMIYDPQNKLKIEEKTFESYDEAMAYRDSFVDEAKALKSGKQNTEFFEGKAKEASSNIPYKPVLDVDQTTPVAKAYSKYTAGGNFTGHISKMIAGFQEKQKQVAEAIVKGGFKSFLDIGTSEGGMIKTVASQNKDMVAVGVDPNVEMQKNFNSTPKVKNAEYRLEAFQGSWTEDDGTEIKEFKTDRKFEVVNEDFTFQFVNNNRDKQVKGVKELMTPNGIFVTSEKFHTANEAANEAKKYDHQRKYFSPDQLTEDKQTIVSGMADDMVNDVDYFNTLKKNFKYVEEFWNAGNFKGYLASDSNEVLQEFKKNVGDLTSEFTDTQSLTKDGRVDFMARVADQLPLTLPVFDLKQFSELRGKMVNPITVQQMLNGTGIKQIEKDLINKAIAESYKGQNKISYDELEATVRASIMPLERITTSSYADYGMDNLGNGNYGNAKTLIFNAPIEHGVTGHFSGAFKASGRQNIKYVAKQLNDNTWVAVEEGYQSQANDNNIYQFVGTAGTKEAVDLWINDYNGKKEIFNKENPNLTIRVSKASDEDTARFADTDIVFAELIYDGKVIARNNVVKRSEEDIRATMIENYTLQNDTEAKVNRGMFGHIRVWQDGEIFYTAELQSDVYQKNNTKKLLTQDKVKKAEELSIEERQDEITKKLNLVIEEMQSLGLPIGASSSQIEAFATGKTNEIYKLRELQSKTRNNRDFNELEDEIDRISTRNYKLYYERKKLIEDRDKSASKLKYEENKDFIKKVENNLEQLLTPQEKQFIASQKIWEQRMVREAIKEASLSGATSLRFPTPYTLSVIEGYVTNDKQEQNTPYNFNGLNDTILKIGETVSDSYDYDELVVVNSTDRNITVKPLFEGISGGKDLVYNMVINQLLAANINFNNSDAKSKYEDFQKDNNVFKDISFKVINSEDVEFVEKVIRRSIEDADIDIKKLLNIEQDNTLIRRNFQRHKTQLAIYDPIKNRVLAWGVGARETTFGQPYTYKDSTKRDFNISDLSDTQQTVARKYEEIAEILKKEKEVEIVTDENGFDWYEAKITSEDIQKPVVAFYSTISQAYAPRQGETQDEYVERMKEEVEANLLGENSEQYFEKIAKENNFTEKEKISFINKVKEFIKSFADWLAKQIGFENLTPEQASQLTNKDILDRVTTSILKGQYKNSLFEDLSSFNRIPVMEVVDGKLMPKKENKVEETIKATLQDDEKGVVRQTLSDVERISPQTWQSSPEAVKTLLRNIEKKAIQISLDLKGLENSYDTKSQAEILSLVRSLDFLLNNPTEANQQNFIEVYEDFMGVVKGDAVAVEKVSEQFRDKPVVKLETKDSEYKVFLETGLLKIGKDTYIKTDAKRKTLEQVEALLAANKLEIDESKMSDIITNDAEYNLDEVKKLIGYKTYFKTDFKEVEEVRSVPQIDFSAQKQLLAPNGKPSNLTPQQYAQVRTPQFKKWFGDWQNDPKNASKVVDENGEPLVVYHGTNAKFDEFKNKVGIRGNQYTGAREVKSDTFFFTDNLEYAEKASNIRRENFGGNKNIVSAFLDIKNPLDFTTFDYNTEEKFNELTGEYPSSYFGYNDTLDQWWRLFDKDEDDVTDIVKEKGYEGVMLAEEVKTIKDKQGYDVETASIKSFGVFNPNQIKSAETNTGEFSSASNNINFMVRPAQELKTDFISEVRKQQLENPDNKVLQNLEFSDKGITLKYTDPISVIEMNDYLKTNEDLKNYFTLSRNTNFELANIETSEFNERDYLVNGGKKENTKEFRKVNNETVIVKTSEDFITIEQDNYERTYGDFFSKLPKSDSNFYETNVEKPTLNVNPKDYNIQRVESKVEVNNQFTQKESKIIDETIDCSK